MPRARNIKHSFFTNDDLADCPPLARILFIGLWTLADCEGRLSNKPRQIKAQILPYDDCCIDLLIDSLEQSGFIQTYTVQLQPIIQIVNFTKHQTPHLNEKKKGSCFLPYDERDKLTNENQQVNEKSRTIGINPDKNDTNQEERGKRKEERGTLKDDPIESPLPENKKEYSDEFGEFWSSYPRRAGNNPKKSAYKAWNSRLKSGADAADIMSGVRRYYDYVDATGKQGTEYVKQASTFLGPDEHYLDEWNLPVGTGNEKNQQNSRKLSATEQAAAAAKRITDRLDREQSEREVHGETLGADDIDIWT